MSELEEKPYWWPEVIGPEWRARLRKDHLEDTIDMDDDALDEYYSEGWRYADTWEHLGDARE